MNQAMAAFDPQACRSETREGLANDMDSHGAYKLSNETDDIWDSILHDLPDSPRLDPLPNLSTFPMDLDFDAEAIISGSDDNEHGLHFNDNDDSEKAFHKSEHDGSHTAEKADHKVGDLCDRLPDQPQSLAKYRPMSKIPSFEELHRSGTVSLQDPTHSYIRFPGSFDMHGRRIPSRRVFDGPEQIISPSTHEPHWKQMLEYFQRWSFWLSHVKDDKRRAELAQMFDQKTAKIWQDGIARGYCDEPNAQKTCCPAHHLDATQVSNKSNPQAEPRKKVPNTAKQPAPFACENGKHAYSITNGELEKHNVTMETIISRTTSETLKSGALLLEEMCARVDRERLLDTDWKPALGRLKFDPRIHNRNLLMYCLWEVQRCRDATDQAKVQSAKATTTHQVRVAQKRIELNQLRADQHLALAVELNERRTKDSSEGSSAEESDVEINSGRRNPSRLVKPVAVINVTSSEEEEETIVGGSESESSTAKSIDRDDGEVRSEPVEAEKHAQTTKDDSSVEPFKQQDVTLPTAANVWGFRNQAVYQNGGKREFAAPDQGDEPSSKRVKFDDRSLAATLHNAPASDNRMNQTRGFHFRYFSTSSDKERALVDDMIGEYVQAILHTKSARFGYYAVFTTGGVSTGKELAHGIWDMQKQQKVNDSTWFYQNRPQPADYRGDAEKLWHNWGYSFPPPPPLKRSKAKTAFAVSRRAMEDGYDYENDGDVDTAPPRGRRDKGDNSSIRRTGIEKTKRHAYVRRQYASPSHLTGNFITNRAHTSANNQKRRGRKHDTNSDDEWAPGL